MTGSASSLNGQGRPWPWLMRNPIRCFGGTRWTLDRMSGRSVRYPRSELWVGAHPFAPSELLDPDGAPLPLPTVLADDPAGVLGPACLARFGPRLPFLVKVLDVEAAQPVQLHPPVEVTAVGYVEEECRAVPADDPSRVYRDPFARLELLYAVTSFDALAGLRPSRHAGYLIDLLDVPRLLMVRARLGAADDVAGALAMLAEWPQRDRRALVAQIDEGAAEALRTRHAAADPGVHAALTWVQRLVEQYPADPLVLAPLLLTLHRLSPGGTLFVPTGVPFSYLSGTAIEITALSDAAAPAPRAWAGRSAPSEPLVGVSSSVAGSGERIFLPPIEEFVLTRLELGAGLLRPVELSSPGDGPQVLLCQAGRVKVEVGGRQLVLESGSSAFLPAGCGPVLLSGRGELFRTTPGPYAASDAA